MPPNPPSFTESFFESRLADKPAGIVEFDFVSTERPPTLATAMHRDEFEVFMKACGLRLSPFEKSLNVDKLRKAVMHIKQTGERAAPPAQKKRAQAPVKATPVGIAASPVAAGGKGAGPGSPTAVPGGGRRRNQIVLKSGKGGGQTPKMAAVDSHDHAHGLDKFKELGEEVKRRNLLHKIMIAGSDDNYSEEHLYEWLKDKSVDVDSWDRKHKSLLHSLVVEKKAEVIATSPPTIFCHVLKVRFVHRKKNMALEYNVKGGPGSDRVAWVTKFLAIDCEKPTVDVAKEAEAWGWEIFGPDFDLKEKGKRKVFEAVLRKTTERSSLVIEPWVFRIFSLRQKKWCFLPFCAGTSSTGPGSCAPCTTPTSWWTGCRTRRAPSSSPRRGSAASTGWDGMRSSARSTGTGRGSSGSRT